MFLATGLEYRRENYEVVAGDDVSWMYGRTNNPAIVIVNQAGGTAVAGIQGFGFTAQLSDEFSLTMDVFQIDIDDRIIFSGEVVPEAAAGCNATNSNCPIRAALAPFNVGQAQFFTNAIDTKTKGIDIVAEYDTELGNGDPFVLSALVHFNDTEVTARHSTSSILPASVLFPDAQVTLVEEGQPCAHHVLGANWTHDAWNVDVRANYFGSVAGEGFTAPFKLTEGGTNIFGQYPDKWDEEAAFLFPQLGFIYGWETVPFGINGGYYFARADFTF